MDLNERLRNGARASTVETPRKLSVDSGLLGTLSQDALMTIASVPEVLGVERNA